MKTIFRWIFPRGEESALPLPCPSAVSSEFSIVDIEHYYWQVIVDCLSRMLVSLDSIEVDVERTGTGRAGLTAFTGYVRILKWDPVVTPVLLQNLSVVDARIRKVVNASFILEHTDFAGVWFQATSSTDGAPKALLGLPCELVHRAGGNSARAQ
jgi:hypothetical protein